MLRLARPHVPHVALEGMSIAVPPKNDGPQSARSQGQTQSFASTVVIDNIDISHARLLILPKRADAKPLDFALEEIHLTSVGEDQRLNYQAKLTNPAPARGDQIEWHVRSLE